MANRSATNTDFSPSHELVAFLAADACTDSSVFLSSADSSGAAALFGAATFEGTTFVAGLYFTAPLLRDCFLHYGNNAAVFLEAKVAELSELSVQCVPVNQSTAREVVRRVLIRMAEDGKTISKADKELECVLRFFARVGSTTELDSIIKLPTPKPPPSIPHLWLLLNQPQYFTWSFDEAARSVFGASCFDLELTADIFETLITHVSNNQHIRSSALDMIRHMALWHALNGEESEASWLLFYSHPTLNNDKYSFRSNPIIQLLVNKGFNVGITGIYPANEAKPSMLTPLEKGKANYEIIRRLTEASRYESLPPRMIIPSLQHYQQHQTPQQRISTNSSDAPTLESPSSALVPSLFQNMSALELLSHLRSSSLRSCIVCNATSASLVETNKSPSSSSESIPQNDDENEAQRQQQQPQKLRLCSKCKCVAYCSREHQALHWKQGHKLECSINL